MCRPMNKTRVDAIEEDVDNNPPRHLHTQKDIGSHLGERAGKLQEGRGPKILHTPDCVINITTTIRETTEQQYQQ